MTRTFSVLGLCGLTALLGACGPLPTDGGTPGDPTPKCPVAMGPTHHQGDVTADETWAAAGSPHLVEGSFKIAKGATLTLEPCAEVRIKAAGITVDGRLVADGLPDRPIHLLADDPAKPWTYLRLMGGTASFSYATLENGGSTADVNGLGLIDVRGDRTQPRQELLHVSHVTMTGSQQFGVSLRDGGTFTADSTDLTISGAALGAIRTHPRLAGNIPAGKYTGNADDEIVIMAEEDLTEDTVLHDRGVPYRVGTAKLGGGDLRVGSAYPGTPRTTLTVLAGVVVKVIPDGRIMMSKNSVGATGVLVAQGSPDRPVVFTSAAPAPAAGDWVGLYFTAPDGGDRMDHVRVEYAGGPSYARSFHCDLTGGLNESEDAAVLLFGAGWAPFISNTVIAQSAGYGIDRAWNGDPVDFLGTNDFQAVAKCKESFPREANGTCPSTVPCP
jgi:hypothetical protein